MRAALVLLLALALGLAAAAAIHAKPDLRPIILSARGGKVKFGVEKQQCHPRTFPRNQDAEINRVEMHVKGGSHHVHLYRPYGGEVVYPPKECPFAVDFSKWQLVAATQNPTLDWQLPPGVAINLGAHQPLMIQTHFVNAQTLSVKGRAKAKIKLHPMDPSHVTAHGGALFGQDRTVRVPPGSSTIKGRCALTGTGADAHDMTIMALTGHYHFRGVRYQVYKVNVDGTLGEQIYDHYGYDDPKFQIYPTEQPLTLRAGEGLEWWCSYENPTSETYEFGANTQRNEHCNLFGFYYPTTTPQEAVDCIHMIDDQGQEQNIRIQARN
jgi:hypothetical protein